MVGGPIGTDACVMGSAIEIFPDGRAEKLERALSRTPDKQLTDLIATSSMVRRTSYMERILEP